MMNGLRKKFFAAVLAMCLVLASASAVYAHDVPDEDAEGSITITLSYEDEAITDGTFAAYRVGDVTEDDGNYFFTLAEAYADAEVTLDDLEDEALAASLLSYIEAYGIQADAVVENTDGTVIFSGLQIGLYLVVQTVSCDGYEAISPFLVSVPTYDDAADAYVYDIVATGKMDSLTLTPVEEVEEETPDETLPQTGQLNWPVPLMTAVGLLLILIGKMLRGSGEPQGASKSSYAA